MAAVETRAYFPGFVAIRRADTPTHEVEVGTIRQDGQTFVVHLIRTKRLSFGGDFLAAKVYDLTERRLLWQFSKYSFEGLGLLAYVGGEIVIALVKNGREGKVREVIPFSTFLKPRQMGFRETIQYKRLAAEYLKRDFDLTVREAEVIKTETARREAQERAEREAAYEARRKARHELIGRILKRAKREAFTADGKKRVGTPVLRSEWASLPNGFYVILVESYDEASGSVGAPIESFQIRKEAGRNPAKAFAARISWQPPRANTIAAQKAPEPIGSALVEIKDEVFEVAVYATMEDVRNARAAGLNSGAYVAARDRRVGDRLEVLIVREERGESRDRRAFRHARIAAVSQHFLCPGFITGPFLFHLARRKRKLARNICEPCLPAGRDDEI